MCNVVSGNAYVLSIEQQRCLGPDRLTTVPFKLSIRDDEDVVAFHLVALCHASSQAIRIDTLQGGAENHPQVSQQDWCHAHSVLETNACSFWNRDNVTNTCQGVVQEIQGGKL